MKRRPLRTRPPRRMAVPCRPRPRRSRPWRRAPCPSPLPSPTRSRPPRRSQRGGPPQAPAAGGRVDRGRARGGRGRLRGLPRRSTRRPAPALTGVLAPNEALSHADLVAAAPNGLEDITFDAEGNLYAGDEDGIIWQVSPAGKVERWADTGGRPNVSSAGRGAAPVVGKIAATTRSVTPITGFRNRRRDGSGMGMPRRRRNSRRTRIRTPRIMRDHLPYGSKERPATCFSMGQVGWSGRR